MLTPCLLAAAWPWSVGAIACALAGLAAAGHRYVTVMGRSDGDEPARAAAASRRRVDRAAFARIAKAAAGCALAGVVLLLSCADSTSDRVGAWSFLLGAALSLLAAWIGSAVSHAAAARAAEAERSSEAAAIAIRLDGESAAGLAAAGLALLGLSIVTLGSPDPAPLIGLALGASIVALLARTGGGRAARSSALSSELLEAHVAVPAAVVVAGAAALRGAEVEADGPPLVVALPLALAGAGVIAALLARGRAAGAALFLLLALALLLLVDRSPLARLGAATGRAAWGSLPGLAGAVAAGTAAALFSSRATGHFRTGAARAALPLLLITAAVLASYAGAGRVGVGLAAVGAATVLRPAPTGSDGRPASVGAGVAAPSAALAALVLLGAYADAARLPALDLRDPIVASGLLFGAMLPFALAASARRSGRPRASTPGRLRAMIPPGLVAVAAPLVVAASSPAALGGLLAGSIACGILLALTRARTGPVMLVVVRIMCFVALLATRR